MDESLPGEFFTDVGRNVSFCPLCDTEFNPLLAVVVGQYRQGQVSHVECRNCRTAIIAVMVQSSGGVSSFGFITDASAEDYARAQKMEPISADDVIDMHVHLQKNTQLSTQLIKTKKV